MKKGKVFTVPFRRKRQGRTYYKKRLKILLSNKFRLVVRKSLRNFQASIIEYNPRGDKVVLSVNSSALRRLGWKGDNGNLPSAYLIGMLAGKKAIDKGIIEVVLDLGLNNSTKGSRLYAAVAGAIDSGLKIPCNPEILPTKDRLAGEHIVNYAKLLKADKPKFNKQFSNYTKNDLDPEEIVKHFNEIRGKINA